MMAEFYPAHHNRNSVLGISSLLNLKSKMKVLQQKFEVGRLLGQGNFGKVYYGRNLNTGQSVAIKAIDKEKVMKVGMIEQTKEKYLL